MTIDRSIVGIDQISTIFGQFSSLLMLVSLHSCSSVKLYLRGCSMRMPRFFASAVSYVSEAMSRIFGLDDDNYPATGVQPFTGDKNSQEKTN
jgi:hypothetical protein